VSLNVRRLIRPEVIVRVDGSRVTVDVNDRGVGRVLYLGGQHEPELRALLAHLDLEGGVCVDVGANVGLHTLSMSRFVGPSGHVVAFEPEPRNYGLLEGNLRLNGARNVTARPCAIGAAEGVARLARNPRNYGDCRITTGMPRWAACEVAVTTLDAALHALPDGAVRFVKIDVQGSECRVLDGMRRTLARHPETVMVLEVFPAALRDAGASPRQLVETLVELGFHGWEFSTHRLLPIGTPWTYDLMTGASTDLIVARDAERLRGIVSRWRGVTL